MLPSLVLLCSAALVIVSFQIPGGPIAKGQGWVQGPLCLWLYLAVISTEVYGI